MKHYVRHGLLGSGLALSTSVAIVVWAQSRLPDAVSIPLHWNASGQPDRFGSIGDARLLLWALPGIAALLSALFAILPSIEPRKKNMDASRSAYVVTWLGVMAVLVALTGVISLNMVRADALGELEDPNFRYFMVGMALLFVVMGNFLPKTRPSFTFGIRTPWTLSDDNVWERTHRMAGPLFVFAGFAGMVGALKLDGGWLVASVTVPVVFVAIVSVVYSYVAWKNDKMSEKSPPSGKRTAA